MIFGQCDPGKTRTTPGENQFESSSLILKMPFYSEKYSAKNQQANLQLIYFPVPHSKLEITTNRTAINVVRPPRFLCPLSALNAIVRLAINALYGPQFARKNQTAPRFLCKPLPDFCANSCTNF